MASAPLWLAGLLLPLLVSCGRSPLTQNPIDTAVSSRRPWTPSTPTPRPRPTPPQRQLLATFVIPLTEEGKEQIIPAQTLSRPDRLPLRFPPETVQLLIQGSRTGRPLTLGVRWQLPTAALPLAPNQGVSLEILEAVWQDHPRDPRQSRPSPQLPKPLLFAPPQVTQGRSHRRELILHPPLQTQGLGWLRLQVRWTSPPLQP
ncbi:MAG: hypothetical protein Q6L49_07745 [Thermostichales cyanobacterium HHBFW_bins_127]